MLQDRDWQGLDTAMESILQDDTRAQLIARNSRATMHKLVACVLFQSETISNAAYRYLSPAANACYWRKLLKAYAALLQPEVHPLNLTNAVDYESFALMRTLDWESH